MVFLFKYWKYIAVGVLIVILVGFGYYIKSVIAQNAAFKIELKQKELQIQEVTKTLETVKTSIKEQNKQIILLNDSLNTVRVEAKEAVQIFNKHNLQALSAAKPELIEKRVNKATQAVFLSIQKDTEDFYRGVIN